MKRTVIAVLSLWAAVLSADPYVGYVYPAGIQRGTTNTFVIGGQSFWGQNGTAVSGKGVRVIAERQVPGFPTPTGDERRWLQNRIVELENGAQIDPAYPTNAFEMGWHSNGWWRGLGKLTALERNLVARDLWIPKNGLQMSPSLRQLRLVTLAADADAPLGARRLAVYGTQWGGASASCPLFVTEAPHAEEPLFAPDAWRKSVTNAAYRASRNRVYDAGNGLFLDGQVMPGETDRFRVTFSAGRWRARVFAARLQPIIGDTVPGYFKAVVDVAGAVPESAEAHAHDLETVFEIPSDGEYSVTVRDALFRGRADFVYMVGLFPEEAQDGIGPFGTEDPYAIRYDPKTRAIDGGGLRGDEPFALYARKSVFSARAVSRVTIPLVVCRRSGFDTPICILENEHLRFENGYIPAGTNSWTLAGIAKHRKAGPVVEFDIHAAAADAKGGVHGARIIPADEYEQAFAWKHLLPADGFLLRRLPPQPPKGKGGGKPKGKGNEKPKGKDGGK